MEHCVNHPNREAVEHCEICDRALCGHCLWYTEDGHRLCETHAQERGEVGETVLPPETYAEALNNQPLSRQPTEKPDKSQNDKNIKDGIPYKGNSQDLTALVAAVMAVTVLLSCMGGAYCLPIAAFVLGIIGFTNASKAVDPQRTKMLAGVSLGVGGLIFLGILAYFGFFFLFFIFTFLAAGGP